MIDVRDHLCRASSNQDRRFRRSGEVRAQRGLDLDVSAGEVVVLLAPSGSGKSTLLNIISGLDHATSGRLLFKNIKPTALNDQELTASRYFCSRQEAPALTCLNIEGCQL